MNSWFSNDFSVKDKWALANGTMMSEWKVSLLSQCCASHLWAAQVPLCSVLGLPRGTWVLGVQAAISLWSALNQVRNARRSENRWCL